MWLRNSSRRDTAVLADLYRFMSDRFLHTNKVSLDILDQESGVESGGFAEKNKPTNGYPSSVTVWVTGDNRTFPYNNVFEGFSTVLYSWEEEFLLVLAHELRHIDQFYGTVPEFFEKDAESYAINTLQAYRVFVQTQVQMKRAA